MSLKNKNFFMQTVTEEQKQEEEAYKNVKILSIDKKEVINCITCRDNSFAVTKELKKLTILTSSDLFRKRHLRSVAKRPSAQAMSNNFY